MGPITMAAVLLRLSTLNELQYRVNFFVYVFQSLLSLGTGLVVVWLVFSNVTELNGWSRPELLVVLGTFTLLGGVIRAVVQPNMLRLIEEIHDGTLDFVLVKPVDAQLFTSIRQIQVWQFVDVVAGVIVIGVGVTQLDTELTVARLVAFGAMITLGAMMVYCFWLIMTTVAFWVLRMEQIAYLFEGAYQAGRWPVTVYPGWMRVSLTFLVPIAFAVTVPAEALTGRLSGSTIALAVALAAALLVGARWFFKVGVRRYAGASA